MDARNPPELMTVSEVADYLRVRERTIYELVRTQRIPSCKLSGKLLFPKRLIEDWVAKASDASSVPARPDGRSIVPPVIAGSHDLLLEWAVRESACGLAVLIDGSLGGIERLRGGQAIACGVHIVSLAAAPSADLEVLQPLADVGYAIIEWAKRRQGLVVAKGNPAKIGGIKDLARKSIKVVSRQDGSGSAILLRQLAEAEGIPLEKITAAGRPVRSESDVAVAVRSGRADAGLAIEAVAREQSLDFVPLVWERFDLIVLRSHYFDEPMQRLMSFARSDAFRERAEELGGYDLSETGRVVLNAPC